MYVWYMQIISSSSAMIVLRPMIVLLAGLVCAANGLPQRSRYYQTQLIEQKGMTFDHNFAINSPFLLPSFFRREEKRRKE